MVLFPPNAWLYQLAMSLYFVSYLSSNILVLRFVLATASLCLFLWAFFVINIGLDTCIWNAVFFLINVCHGGYLLWMMRDVKFKSQEFEDVYTSTFAAPMSAMSRTDFLLLTSIGYVRDLNANSSYSDRGNKIHSLSILVSGKMGVYTLLPGPHSTTSFSTSDKYQEEALVNEIYPFQFVDSPQWMNRYDSKVFAKDIEAGVFHVTIRAIEDCRFIMWPIEAIDDLIKHHPRFLIYLESVMGRDVAMKLLCTDMKRQQPQPEPTTTNNEVSGSKDLGLSSDGNNNSCHLLFNANHV
jgi:CRP-like cAMP-binding protein